ncbi:MAG: ABC transporter permease subunit [Planctomycetota bacterium]
MRRELGALFEAPITYVALAMFVVVLPLLFFLVGFPVGRQPLPGLFEGGQANLIVLFTWLPLLLALLVPALSMSAWAEERRSGTEELVLTWPVRASEVALGKFLARTVLLALMVSVAVIPSAVAVAGLGDLDWGPVWVGLGGAIILAAAYCALALWVSALVEEQLAAFLLGAALLVGLWALDFAVALMPAWLAGTLRYSAPGAHFLDSAALGVVDARDGVYFALFIVFGLTLNVVAVERRRWR